MLKNKFVVLFTIFLFFSLCTYLPLPWNDTLKDTIIDVQFKIRGDRSVTDEIVIVYIGDEDIQALEMWPLTRDYYGYFVHAVSSMGAKVVSMDLLFATQNQTHPEFDVALSNFIKNAKNVCLPMIFSELEFSNPSENKSNKPAFNGINPLFPLDKFIMSNTNIGFSNLSGSGIIRKIPLMVGYQDTTFVSLGLEMARVYFGSDVPIKFHNKELLLKSQGVSYKIQTDQYTSIRLNHIGNLENWQSYSFVELLQNFEDNTEALNLKDKLIFLIVSASGVSNIHATPLTEIYPASLIHATVAENIIQDNYLKEIPVILEIVIIALMIILLALLMQIKNRNWFIFFGISIPIVFWIVAQIIFSSFNTILPVFYPTITYLIVLFISVNSEKSKKQKEDESIKELLEEQIRVKELSLKETQEELDGIQKLLAEETATSVNSMLIAQAQKEKIVRLSKDLEDLKSYVIPHGQIPHLKFSEIIHAQESPMQEVLDLITKVSSDDIPVLIVGDTGTGKELIARGIHQSSQRKTESFVAVNCGALSETLLESELFGHEKGSFTGANTQRRGRFELADGGTIFLDEISETTPAFQTRLLRVLQEGSFERLGGERTQKVDVRILAATNKDLQLEMSEDRFRSDLYYRLNGIIIQLPPLQERIEDIPLLVNHFLKKYDYDSVTKVSDRAIEILTSYSWPGNVRELENSVRRAAILARSAGRSIIQSEDFSEDMIRDTSSKIADSIHKPIDEQILEMLRVLKFSRSAITQTAKALGNKDRGTITEYFRGMCFEKFVKSEFNIESAAREIANSDDSEIINRVTQKLNEYLENLKSHAIKDANSIQESDQMSPAYKGLPKKYHTYLDSVITYLQESTG